MSLHTIKTAFNSGLLSPLMDPRSEVEKYASGCRKLENFIPRTYGAAFKRPGMEYLGQTKGAGEACLKPFNYSVDTRFVFEFGDQYLRFWSNGERVTMDVPSVSTWSGTTTQYTIGTPVWQSNILYRALSTHTPSGGNQPPSASWTTTNLKKWAASTAYSVGDLVWYATSVSQSSSSFGTEIQAWVCTTGHTSSTTFDDTKFSKALYHATWWTGVVVTVGQRAVITTGSNQYRYFRCKLAHTTSAATKPASGASWSTYWQEVNNPPAHDNSSYVYKKGDLVRVGSTVYVSSTDHTSSGSNEPTDGGSPWHVVTGIPAWVGTSTTRTDGDWVLYGSMIFQCFSTGTYTTYLPFASFSFLPSTIGTWTSTPTYEQGDIVSNGTASQLYYCIQDHATATTTEPGTTGGEDYWELLANLQLWVTSTNYTAGQYVLQAGAFYRVASDHTSGTFATDLSNGLLVAEDYPLELPTPYALEDVWQLQHMQINDQVWLLHPDYETLLLERLGDVAWRIRSIPWDWPPMRDENIDEAHTLTASATTGDITLTGSARTFEAGNVGSYFQISHYRDNATRKKVLSSTGATSAMRVIGRLDIFIYGTAWVGEVALQKSKDGSTNWQTVRTWDQPVANMRTISTNLTVTEEAYYRLNMTARTAGTASDYAVMEAADSRVNGLVRITGVSSPTVASATVIEELHSTAATTIWAESAYSDRRGWPRTGTLHELRVILAGANDEPQTIRGSSVDDFFNWKESTLDDGPFSFTLAATESNAIQWVQSVGGGIAAGTTGEEWIMDSGSADRSITASNVRAKLQSRYGSSSLPSLVIGDAAIFFQRDARRTREFTFSFESDKFVAPDLTLLAEHVTRSGIKQVAATRQPDVVMWCVLNDGRVAAMTYEREQAVVAWSEHTTDGEVESVCVIYGGETDADEVWFVVKRTIDGEDVRYMERLETATSKFDFTADAEDLCHLDSAILVTNAPASTAVSGLDHLEGESVYALADGVAVGPFTVTSGAITLATAASNIWVGIAYTAILQGMRIETAMQDGTAQGRKFKLDRMVARLYESNGFEFIADPDDSTLSWRTIGDVSDVDNRIEDPADLELPVESRHDRAVNLTLRSSKPLPVNILALVYKFNVFGD